MTIDTYFYGHMTHSELSCGMQTKTRIWIYHESESTTTQNITHVHLTSSMIELQSHIISYTIYICTIVLLLCIGNLTIGDHTPCIGNTISVLEYRDFDILLG